MPSSYTPLTPTKRRAICVLRDTTNMPFEEIGAKLGCDKSTAVRNYHKFHETHDWYQKPTTRGRPRAMDDYQRRLAVRKLRSGAARDGADLQRQEFPDIGASTVRRTLAEMGFHGRRRRKMARITLKHAAARRKFANLHIEWEVEKWGTVIFSDEAKFMLHGSDGAQYCRRGPNEAFKPQYVDPRVKHGGGSVMVWGCITRIGFGRLVRIEGTMDGDLYCEVLEKGLLGTLSDLGLDPSQVIFQQDNDSKHTSRVARAWIAENLGETLPWPPSSPDINIIENAWHTLDIRVHRRNPLPRTEEQLWQALQEEWGNLGKEYLDNLYASLPDRVKAVKAAKGFYTKY